MVNNDSEYEPLIRVMALHALLYCERLFYLEEVEGIRVQNERVYAGRALHEEIAHEDGEYLQTMEMESEKLGLIGKADAIQFRDGSWVPYEHKRGRSMTDFKDGRKVHKAWLSDMVQIGAYGMLMEVVMNRPIVEGRVHYHADNVTVRVPLDDDTRSLVMGAVKRARALRKETVRPPITDNEHACIRCSLAPVCLPEEERLAQNQCWEPIRLFPPDHDKTVIHVVSHRAYVRRSGNMIKVEEDGQELKTCPIQSVQSVVIHGNAQITTQALQLCATNDIPVHWLSAGGKYVGGLASGAMPVQRRIRQYRALCDPKCCLSLTHKLVRARIEGQLRYLLRATRGHIRTNGMTNALNAIRNDLKAVMRCNEIDEIRGYEGNASRSYFGVVNELIIPEMQAQFALDGRNRRPPQDRSNAILSFGYALLYRSVLEAIVATGMEPAFGFYHTPRSAAHPLVLDLMELFRLPIWDIAVIGSINRKTWDPVEDFVITKSKTWLSDSGRKKAIDIYERRLQEKWKHSVMGYSLSYARTIELEVRLLEKEWTSQPGLFAQSRLR